MWPLLLDMQTAECKKALRTLELEAYTSIVSAFRAQGDLTSKKLEILKDLQTIFRISLDRHKAELRRATNDERLFTIAKRLSHGQEVSIEWLKQCKRNIPLLPSFRIHSDQSTDSDSVTDRPPSDRYRILADQILSKLQPTLNFYKTENDQDEGDEEGVRREESLDDSDDAKTNGFSNDLGEAINSKAEDEKNLIYLKNGYVVDPNSITIENMKPSEYIKKAYSSCENEESTSSSTFMKSLIKKFREQQAEKERLAKLEEKREKQAEEEAAALAAAQRLKAAAAAVVNQHASLPLTDSSKYYTKLVLNNDYITLIKNNQLSNASHHLIDSSTHHIIEQPTTTIKLGPTITTTPTQHHQQQPHQMIKLTTQQINTNQPSAQIISTTSIEPNILTSKAPTHIRLTTDGLKSATTTNSTSSNQKLIYLPTSPVTTPAISTTAKADVSSTPSSSSSAPNLIQKLVLYKKPSATTTSTSAQPVTSTQTLASPTTGILKPVCDDTLSTAALTALTPANENLIRTSTINTNTTTTPTNIKLSFNQQFLNLPQTSVSIGKQILLNVPSNTNNSTTATTIPNSNVTATPLKPPQLPLKILENSSLESHHHHHHVHHHHHHHKPLILQQNGTHKVAPHHDVIQLNSNEQPHHSTLTVLENGNIKPTNKLIINPIVSGINNTTSTIQINDKGKMLLNELSNSTQTNMACIKLERLDATNLLAESPPPTSKKIKLLDLNPSNGNME